MVGALSNLEFALAVSTTVGGLGILTIHSLSTKIADQLKTRVKQLEGDVEHWMLQAQDAFSKRDEANARFQESARLFEAMEVEFNKLVERSTKLLHERATALAEQEHLAQQVKGLEAKMAGLMQDKIRLQSELAGTVKAKRGPSGRFVKAKTESFMGTTSGEIGQA